jgi:hypothetical protein
MQAELLTTAAQLTLNTWTAILLGVHGNGLTHMLILAPTIRSTVIETFYPEEVSHDYRWSIRALEMKHFGVCRGTSGT